MKKYIQPYANRTSMCHRVNAIIAVLLSVVMIAGMASGIVPAILPILKHAHAAEQTPAYVEAKLTKISDGTGFGTTNQSFVNSENGFEVGDNAPNDGVVSSGDVVNYNLKLAFTASKKRAVRVRWTFDNAPYLEGSNAFCFSGSQVQAIKQDDGSCIFIVPTGAVESLTREVYLKARDTGGRVVPDQRAVLTIERVEQDHDGNWVLAGQQIVNETSPVTVVSAPAADVTIRNYSNSSSERRTWMSENGDSTGYFDLVVEPLSYPGWSTHGASTSGAWWGTVNVATFPQEVTWQLKHTVTDADGSTHEEVVDVPRTGDTLTLPKIHGDAQLIWTAPNTIMGDDWKENQTKSFDIQILPDKKSFSSGDGSAQALLNMGTGTEPGLNQPKDYNTRNDEINSQKGYPYPNNDWSRANMTRPSRSPSPGGKDITRPWTWGRTVFDPANQDFDKAQQERSVSAHTGDGSDVVSQNTQVRIGLAYDTAYYHPVAGQPIVLEDFWRKDEQFWDGDVDQLKVVQKYDQTSLHPDWKSFETTLTRGEDYDVYYTTTDPAITPTGNLQWRSVGDNWTLNPPAQRDKSIVGIRFVIKGDKVNYNYGRITASFVARAGLPHDPDHPDQLATGDGEVADYMQSTWYSQHEGSDQPSEMRSTNDNYYNVTQPRDPTADLEIELEAESPNGTKRDAGNALPGDLAHFTLTPVVKGIMLSGTAIKPEIRIPLPDGMLSPRMYKGPWNLRVEEVDGQKYIVLTPNTEDGKFTPTVDIHGDATLPKIEFYTDIGNRATGLIMANAVLTVDTDANGSVPAKTTTPVARNAQLQIGSNWTQGAALDAIKPQVEVRDQIGYDFNIAARGTGREGTSTTVIRLPASDADKAMRGKGCSSDEQDATDCQGLDGTWNGYESGYSQYHGGWKLSSPVTLEQDDSTPTEFAYAVDNIYSEDPADYKWMTWDELQKLPEDQRKVTAIRVVSTFTDTTDPTDGTSLGIAAAHGSFNLDITDTNQGNDKYVAWIGKSRFTQEIPPDKQAPTVPFPAVVTTVAGTLSGTVWWDQDRSTTVGKAEERIEGVNVSLWMVDKGGSKLSDKPYAIQKTDEQGFYKFTNLHSGNYLVTVERHDGTVTDTGVQTLSDTYYNQQMNVERTRTYKKVLDQTLPDNSGSIALNAAQDVTKVDFGYLKPDPKVTLDKTTQKFACSDERCQIAWDVVVTNPGTEPLPTSSVLTDRMSTEITRVQVKVGTRTSSPKPTSFTAVSNGYNHTVALDEQGHIWSWGDNSHYQLGDGTNVSRTTPQMITVNNDPNLKFVQVEAGEDHTMAVDSQGRLWGWGLNDRWQVTGNPQALLKPTGGAYNGKPSLNSGLWEITSPRLVEFKDPQGNELKTTSGQPVKVAFVSSRYATTIVIDQEGKLWSWGWNWGFAAGQSTIPTSWNVAIAPVQTCDSGCNIKKDGIGNLGSNITFTKVVTGDRFALALASNGEVYGFGSELWGEQGRLSTDKGNYPPARLTFAAGLAKDIAASENSSYILGTDGNVYVAGRNDYGQLGLGYKNGGSDKRYLNNDFKKSDPISALQPTQLWGGDSNAVALAADGSLYAWGGNNKGQLGESSKLQQQQKPIKLIDASLNPQAVAVSSKRSEAHGVTDNPAPAQWGFPANDIGFITAIVDGKVDGSTAVVGFGSDASGQLGDGKTTASPVSTMTYAAIPIDYTADPPDDPTAQAIDPVSTTVKNTYVERAYNLPQEIPAGGQLVFHITGEMIRRNEDQRVFNQAFFTSDKTPYSVTTDGNVTQGVPHAINEKAETPTVPDLSKIDTTTLDITGNKTCMTGTDNSTAEHSFALSGEDSCDQVGLVIPHSSATPVLGSISGVMWRDNNKDGKRDPNEPAVPGIKVYLLDSNGNRIPGYETTTDENGAYSFTDLELATYRVQFSEVPRSPFTQSDVNDSDPTTDMSSDDSDVSFDEDTYGMDTAIITLTTEHKDKDHIDAGVLPAKSWMGAMPQTGLGWWVFILLGSALLTFAGAAWELTRKDDSERE